MNPEQIHPLADRLLVRRMLRPEKTEGGIVLPDQTREISQTGEILVVGPDVKTLARGDIVLFSAYAARPLVDEDLMIVREVDVFARIEPISQPVMGSFSASGFISETVTMTVR